MKIIKKLRKVAAFPFTVLGFMFLGAAAVCCISSDFIAGKKC